MVFEAIVLLLGIAGVTFAWIIVFWIFDQGILDGLLSHHIQKFIRDKLEKEG